MSLWASILFHTSSFLKAEGTAKNHKVELHDVKFHADLNTKNPQIMYFYISVRITFQP